MPDPGITVCLVLGPGFLAHDGFAVNPDAVATAGASWQVHQRAPVALVADPPLGAALSAIATRAAPAAHGFVRASCPAETSRRALADTAPRDGMVWLPPDRIDSGTGPAMDYARTLAELSGLSDPRPIAPWRRPLDLWRINPAPPPDTLLAHLFTAPRSSWITLGPTLILATDAPPPADAQPLGQATLGTLYLAPPSGGDVLYQTEATALLATAEDAPPPNATPWVKARFSRWP